MDAALALFMVQGYAATSVDAIAARAGISKGAVYLYFPSKQAVLEALVVRAVGSVSAAVLAQVAAHPGGFREQITLLLTFMGHKLSEPGALAIPKIIIREAVVAPEIADIYRRAVLDKAIPAVTGLVRAGIAAGELRPVDPELTVRSIIGPILAHVLMAEIFNITPQGGLNIERLVANHLDILLDGLATKRGADDE